MSLVSAGLPDGATKALFMGCATANEGVKQNVTVLPDEDYTLSVWVTSTSATSFGRLRTHEYPSGTQTTMDLSNAIGGFDRTNGIHHDQFVVHTQSGTTSMDVMLLVAGGALVMFATWTHVMLVRGINDYRYRRKFLTELDAVNGLTLNQFTILRKAAHIAYM
jgi:hypothetical protein